MQPAARRMGNPGLFRLVEARLSVSSTCRPLSGFVNCRARAMGDRRLADLARILQGAAAVAQAAARERWVHNNEDQLAIARPHWQPPPPPPPAACSPKAQPDVLLPPMPALHPCSSLLRRLVNGELVQSGRPLQAATRVAPQQHVPPPTAPRQWEAATASQPHSEQAAECSTPPYVSPAAAAATAAPLPPLPPQQQPAASTAAAAADAWQGSGEPEVHGLQGVTLFDPQEAAASADAAAAVTAAPPPAAAAGQPGGTLPATAAAAAAGPAAGPAAAAAAAAAGEAGEAAPPKRKFVPRERAVPSSSVGRVLGFAQLGGSLLWGTARESVSRALGGGGGGDKQAADRCVPGLGCMGRVQRERGGGLLVCPVSDQLVSMIPTRLSVPQTPRTRLRPRSSPLLCTTAAPTPPSCPRATRSGWPTRCAACAAPR